MIVALLLLFVGAGVYIYPYLTEQMYRENVENQYRIFFDEANVESDKYERLYQRLQEENEKLFCDKQAHLTNVSAYEKAGINLRSYSLQEDYIGFIEIPKMNIKLPVYLGASEENMKKGAVHLTETSYPVEGNNTNCVIAAHRGYSKAAMFRDIEILEEGDFIFIDNLWERLTYKVKECRVISPEDTECLKIEGNKELLTLLTCHPYRYNYQRYVVICEKAK